MQRVLGEASFGCILAAVGPWVGRSGDRATIGSRLLVGCGYAPVGSAGYRPRPRSGPLSGSSASARNRWRPIYPTRVISTPASSRAAGIASTPATKSPTSASCTPTISRAPFAHLTSPERQSRTNTHPRRQPRSPLREKAQRRSPGASTPPRHAHNPSRTSSDTKIPAICRIHLTHTEDRWLQAKWAVRSRGEPDVVKRAGMCREARRGGAVRYMLPFCPAVRLSGCPAASAARGASGAGSCARIGAGWSSARTRQLPRRRSAR